MVSACRRANRTAVRAARLTEGHGLRPVLKRTPGRIPRFSH